MTDLEIQTYVKALPPMGNVLVIRPLFGKQSDSFIGQYRIFQNKEDEGMISFNTDGNSMLFSINDIKSIELRPHPAGDILVFRLKGLEDYPKNT